MHKSNKKSQKGKEKQSKSSYIYNLFYIDSHSKDPETNDDEIPLEEMCSVWKQFTPQKIRFGLRFDLI